MEPDDGFLFLSGDGLPLTHPAPELERKAHAEHHQDGPDMDPADVLAALDEDADENGENG